MKDGEPVHVPGRRILVADDAPECLRIVAWALKKAGMWVDLAADGIEALDKIEASRESHPFDLILADCEMPRMGGLQLAQVLRAAGIITPVVALTGHKQESLKESACEFAAVLTKPISPETLIRECSRILAP
ncbi:MAG: response regulator [Pirellulales bacterium]|nr:response regulator [Pirellulales bacterium]